MKKFKIYKTPDGKFYATKKSWFFGVYFPVMDYHLVECFVDMGHYTKEWYRVECDSYKELITSLDARFYSNEEDEWLGYYEI